MGKTGGQTINTDTFITAKVIRKPINIVERFDCIPSQLNTCLTI